MTRNPATIVAFLTCLLACNTIAAAATQEKALTGACASGHEKVLLVFNAGPSTVAVNPADPGAVIVRIADADSLSVEFGDRPSRRSTVVGTKKVIEFLDQVAGSNPVNLAIVGQLEGAGKETLVIEVLGASHQPEAGKAVLEGRLLEVLDAATDATLDMAALGGMAEGRSYESIDVFIDDLDSCCPPDTDCDQNWCSINP